ncbi:hypothetical protein [Spiroplasma endosymbiont of Virgichneumon dumeticola]|uniref:hypothetical protein n=1 Tax=Spiroplasma endosymbiont of Virgichneumon dumeticola TaxID=3139323 RepID=UPI0035C91713
MSSLVIIGVVVALIAIIAFIFLIKIIKWLAITIIIFGLIATGLCLGFGIPPIVTDVINT